MLKKLFIFTTALLAFSCHKNDSPVGVNVLPSSDQLDGAWAEVIPSITYSQVEDSIMTTNVSNSNLLGSVNDPVFGRFDASVYIDFEVEGVPSGSLGVNPVLDSAVLKLDYNTVTAIPCIGDTNNPLTIDVFPLTQKLIRDSLYYSTRNTAYDGSYSLIEGGSKTFVPHLKSRVQINKDDPGYYTPQLRIRLKKEFGEKLFNISTLWPVGTLQSVFPGMFITTNRSILPQPSYGSVFYVNSLNSRVYLYYHTDDAKGPLAPIELQCGPNSTRYGRFEHDYRFLAEPGLAQQLAPIYDTGQNGPGKQNIYLQGAGGLRAHLDFSKLLQWRDSNVVINKAELYLKIDNSNPDYFDAVKYPAPLKLFLDAIDPATGKPTSLVENVYAFGGDYNSTTNSFSFNIPHTVSQIINKKRDYTIFRPSIYQSGLFPHRVVLGGWGNSHQDTIKLKIWYTRLKFPKK